LAGRREKSRLPASVPPPESRKAFVPESLKTVPTEPGVFRLIDCEGRVLQIKGVDDLRRGLTEALADPPCTTAAFFQMEPDPLFTQRESELLARYAQEQGHLPPGNDLGDELFADD
jgi:hypothetical protein